MALISITEYAEMHGKSPVTVRQKAARGYFETAQKIGNTWVIDSEEVYTDVRIKSGKYINSRKNAKKNRTEE